MRRPVVSGEKAVAVISSFEHFKETLKQGIEHQERFLENIFLAFLAFGDVTTSF